MFQLLADAADEGQRGGGVAVHAQRVGMEIHQLARDGQHGAFADGVLDALDGVFFVADERGGVVAADQAALVGVVAVGEELFGRDQPQLAAFVHKRAVGQAHQH